MAEAMDYAKFFLKHRLDTHRNTYDGNMKLQKLLFFANLISLVKTNQPLFPDVIRAYSNGCVVESVRLRYKNDCAGFCADSRAFNPCFTQNEYDILNLTTTIFGHLSARELSDLNHCFAFWQTAYNRSCRSDGFKDKSLSVIHNDEMLQETDRVRAVIDACENNHLNCSQKELINGKTFFYSPDFDMTDEVIERLEAFSRVAEDDAYSVYFDNGELVIM